MSNLVHPLPISEAEVEVTMCVSVIPVDVNERRHVGYYVKGDQQSNYLPCYVPTFHINVKVGHKKP